MTDVVLVALIAAAPGTVAAITSYFNGRRIQATRNDVVEVRHEINSRMDKALTAADQIGYDRGRREEEMRTK